MNPWLSRRVIAYTHQGGAKEAPASTLYAIEVALGAGATAIELDVHSSADDVLMVCHDPTLDRTTNGAGAISDRRANEIALLDNAYWYVEGKDTETGLLESSYPFRGRAPDDRRFGLARLDEVLGAFPDVLFNFDIKQTAPEVKPYEEHLARMLKDFRGRDDVIVASFNDRSLDEFSRFAPDIATAAGAKAITGFVQSVRANERPDASISKHVALQLPSTFGGVVLVDDRLVEVAHEYGLAVHVWTIDDEREMEALVKCGVDGIMSDRPRVLVEVLARLGVTYRR